MEQRVDENWDQSGIVGIPREDMTGARFFVEMRQISKNFGPVAALKEVDFYVKHGEIVGLVGDNGAGKSTLIKILTGALLPDKGEIFVEGTRVYLRSTAEARRFGIEAVYQGVNIAPQLSVWRNFFLGREKRRSIGIVKLLDTRWMRQTCTEVLRDIGVNIPSVQSPAGVLSGGERQAINIGRAMFFEAKLLVLDEPTTALSVKETDRILEFICDVRSRCGTAVVFVTHNINHVYAVADRFVLLERGVKRIDLAKNCVSERELLSLLGRK